MGRKKVVTEETFEPGEKADNAEILLADPNAPIEDELAGLLGADDSDDVKYTVHKMPTKPGERVGYCNTYTRGDLSLDTIRSTFGGGQYRITGRDGKNQYVTSKQVTIVDLPKAPGLGGVAPSADLAAILMAAKGSDSSAMVMPLLMAMIKSQGDMMAAIANRPQEKGPTAMELIAMMKSLQPEKDSGSEAVKLLMQGLTLGKEIGGGGETGMLDVAKQGLEMLAPLVANQAKNPAPVRVPRPNGHAPQPAQLPPQSPPPMNAAPVVQAPQGNPMMQKLMWIRQLTQTLIVHAIKDHSPDTYAEVVLDNLPPFITEQEILERLTPDNAVAQLARLNPQVTEYAPWFEQFRVAVLDMLSDDPEEPAPPADVAPHQPESDDLA